jgi:hypothetical protein
MKSSSDCQIIIDITIQILVGGVCDTKVDSLRYPRLCHSINGEHACRVRLAKMTQSATNLLDMDSVQHTAALEVRPPKEGFKLMNKTLRDDPRGAQCRNETGGRRLPKKEPKAGYWPAETRAESPTQVCIPAVIGFFVSFAYLCSPALLPHAIV